MFRSLRLLFIIALSLYVANALYAAQHPPVAFGDKLSDFSLPTPSLEIERAYLGVGDKQVFTPSQVKAELLVVEVMNVHCAHCQMQAPAFNELYKLIEADAATRGRAKLLGVALGNLPEEVVRFRTSFPTPFPVIADPKFVAYRTWGVSSTPFTIYVRQVAGQPGLVVGTHSGLNTDYRALFAELKDYLDTDLAKLRQEGRQAEQRRSMIRPLYTEDELQQKVREAFINTGGAIELFKKVTLRSGRQVYAARMRVDDRLVSRFAEVTSRQSVCDICHDVHFIYLFDASGRIVGFEPLQVTKYGNVHWTPAEAEQMRRRLVGQYLSAPRPFDPKLDAVTAATISSAIIFDSIAQGEELLDALREQGYLPR